jgi:tetratricopeptide (TPR) repeat protein
MVVTAQVDKVDAALELYRAGKLGEAQKAIDAAVKEPAYSQDHYSWYVRGFIYKDLFKQLSKSDPETTTREEAVSSFFKAIELDKENENLDDNKTNIKFLATTYYNDAGNALIRQKFEVAQKHFQNFKNTLEKAGLSSDVQDKELEYLFALASAYTVGYQNDKTKEHYFTETEKIYQNILKSNPENIGANYNLGILYYNKAVSIYNELDYDTDIFLFMEIQDKTVEIFKQALPFMEKAYKLDPKRKETLKGLEGIYHSLNETEKVNEVRAQLEKLEK